LFLYLRKATYLGVFQSSVVLTLREVYPPDITILVGYYQLKQRLVGKYPVSLTDRVCGKTSHGFARFLMSVEASGERQSYGSLTMGNTSSYVFSSSRLQIPITLS
jgi:hypothetical protein